MEDFEELDEIGESSPSDESLETDEGLAAQNSTIVKRTVGKPSDKKTVGSKNQAQRTVQAQPGMNIQPSASQTSQPQYSGARDRYEVYQLPQVYGIRDNEQKKNVFEASDPVSILLLAVADLMNSIDELKKSV